MYLKHNNKYVRNRRKTNKNGKNDMSLEAVLGTKDEAKVYKSESMAIIAKKWYEKAHNVIFELIKTTKDEN